MADFEILPAVEWTSKPLFNLDVARADVERRFGLAPLRDLDSNGVGDFDAWPIRFQCGLEVLLWWFTQTTRSTHLLEVHANDLERGHILFHLGFAGVEPSLWEPDTCLLGPAGWRVLRIDDNGNTVEVGRTTSECEARALVATLERRGHKQTYWYGRA